MVNAAQSQRQVTVYLRSGHCTAATRCSLPAVCEMRFYDWHRCPCPASATCDSSARGTYLGDIVATSPRPAGRTVCPQDSRVERSG
jgi:hypothetical protein